MLVDVQRIVQDFRRGLLVLLSSAWTSLFNVVVPTGETLRKRAEV